MRTEFSYTRAFEDFISVEGSLPSSSYWLFKVTFLVSTGVTLLFTVVTRVTMSLTESIAMDFCEAYRFSSRMGEKVGY